MRSRRRTPTTNGPSSSRGRAERSTQWNGVGVVETAGSSEVTKQVPIFIICRDRVTPLAQLVDWLERHGHERLILVDNASTYPPLCEYLDRSPHDVVRLSQNVGPRDCIWSLGTRDRYASGEPFVVTDCDVVPDADCPGDALDYFDWALRRYPGYSKAGFGLRIDDLPDCYALADEVRRWEGQFWRRRFGGNLYHADIDNTFALYRPDSNWTRTAAIRTGQPYVARHSPWYMDSAHLSEEEEYYRDHCSDRFAHWDLSGMNTSPSPDSIANRLRWWARLLLKTKRERTVPRRYSPGI